MLFNTVIVGNFKLIDLMSSDKKSEKQKLKKPAVCAVLFLIGAGLLGYAYYKVAYDLFDIENAFEMLIYMAMGATGTFLIFWSVSGIITRLVTVSKKLYHRSLNCFTFRQICSRINTMVMSATIICLMLFVTICTLAAAFSLKDSSSKNVDRYAPADFCAELYSGDGTFVDVDMEEIYRNIGLDTDEYFSEKVQFTEYKLNDFSGKEFFGEYLDEAQQKSNGLFLDSMPEPIMYLSEYNRLAQLYGFETLSIPGDGYAVVCDHPAAITARNIPLEAGHAITVQGAVLHPAYPECRYGLDVIAETAVNLGIIVVSDDLRLDADQKLYCLAGKYKAQTKEEKRETDKLFADSYDLIADALMPEKTGGQYRSLVVLIDTRIRILDSGVGLGAAATLIGLYVGIVFLLSCGAILSIKMLSENIDSQQSYDILRKIGADEKDINRSLFRQTGVFFLLPLLLACIHSVFGIKFSMNVLAVFNVTGLLPAMLVTAAIVVVIYGGYFLITYFCGKGMIRNRS